MSIWKKNTEEMTACVTCDTKCILVITLNNSKQSCTTIKKKKLPSTSRILRFSYSCFGLVWWTINRGHIRPYFHHESTQTCCLSRVTCCCISWQRQARQICACIHCSSCIGSCQTLAFLPSPGRGCHRWTTCNLPCNKESKWRKRLVW